MLDKELPASSIAINAMNAALDALRQMGDVERADEMEERLRRVCEEAGIVLADVDPFIKFAYCDHQILTAFLALLKEFKESGDPCRVAFARVMPDLWFEHGGDKSDA